MTKCTYISNITYLFSVDDVIVKKFIVDYFGNSFYLDQNPLRGEFKYKDETP